MRSLFALFALPLAASAASLAEFKPAVSDLPSACDDVYNSQIPDCVDADFSGGGSCSKACFVGLTRLSISVMKNCANQGITGHNVIVAMLSGSGPSQLCPQNSDSSNQDSSSSSSATQQSTTSSATSSSSTSSSSQSASSASSTSSSTAQAQSTSRSTTSTSIATASGTPTPPSSSASTTTSSSRGFTSSVSFAHAGSPFDTTVNLRSDAIRNLLDSHMASITATLLSYFALALI